MNRSIEKVVLCAALASSVLCQSAEASINRISENQTETVNRSNISQVSALRLKELREAGVLIVTNSGAIQVSDDFLETLRQMNLLEEIYAAGGSITPFRED